MRAMAWVRRAVGAACLLACCVLLGSPSTHADVVGLDIRSDGVLLANATTASYVARIDDCSNLLSVSTNGADAIPASDALPVGNTRACQVRFHVDGNDRLHPQLAISLRDQSLPQTHDETFVVEGSAPAIAFESVAIATHENKQTLVVTVRASDDIDVSYVSLSVVGMRVSRLRAAGGLVQGARGSAFADSHGQTRVVPTADGQQLFRLSLPLTQELSPAEIASDGMVLVDATAVDASGNQSSFSKVAFTGQEVRETVSDLAVNPSAIMFTSLFQTATLVPSVRFQFRGVRQLPGSGTGVTYRSSHPELVSVSAAGVVRPLASTGTTSVSVSVAYPGLPAITVPVSTDVDQSVASIAAEGLSAGGRIEIERLNMRVPLPRIFATFGNDERADITTQFAIDWSVDAGNAAILSVDPATGLLATAAISAARPATLTARLHDEPLIFVTIPVIATDALPDVALVAPAQVQVGSQLALEASASDDVAVREVRFFLDDALLATRTTRRTRSRSRRRMRCAAAPCACAPTRSTAPARRGEAMRPASRSSPSRSRPYRAWRSNSRRHSSVSSSAVRSGIRSRSRR